MSEALQNPLRDQLDALVKISPKNGGETWSARELREPLGYAKWESLEKVIARVIEARREAGMDSVFHFRALTTPAGEADYRLTRLACHLVVMAGDGRRKAIAFARAYFAEAPVAQPAVKPATKPAAPVVVKKLKAKQTDKAPAKPTKVVAPKAKCRPVAKAEASATPAGKNGSRFIPQKGGGFYGSSPSRNSRWNPNCAVSRGYHNRAASNGR